MNLKNLFKPKAADVEIIFTRTCFVGGVQYIEGTRASFDRKTASEIIASDAAADPQADLAAVAKADDLSALLPPPVEQAPVPESWSKLPACFSAWWKLNEARNALITRRDATEGKLMEWYCNRSPDFKRGLTALPAEQSRRIFSGMNFEINTDLPQDLEKLRFFKDAVQRLNQSISAWQDANQDDYVRAQLDCSTHTQVVHGALCKGIRELHGKAFELFSLRISALGLSGHKVAELFQGSGDCERFASISAPSMQDLRLGWSEPGQDPVHYINRTPITLSQNVASYLETSAQVEELTTQADKELATARKVTAKAA